MLSDYWELLSLVGISTLVGMGLQRWVLPSREDDSDSEDEELEDILTPKQLVHKILPLIQELEEDLGGKVLLMVDHDDHAKIDPRLRGKYWIDLEDEVQFLHLLSQFKEAPLFLMLCTDGGSITSSDAMVRVLREYPHSTSIVPYKAYSAGSLLALSTRHLLMGPYALLSPFDPQLDLRLANNKPQSFSSRLLMELDPATHPEMETLAHLTQLDAQIYHQDNMLTTTQILSDKYPPSVIQEVKEHLCTGDYPHSKPFHRNDLQKMGLEIGEIADERWLELASYVQEYRNRLLVQEDQKKASKC